MKPLKKILSVFLSGLILANFLNLNITTYAESSSDDDIDIRVSTMAELKDALSNNSVFTIAVTGPIYLDGSDLDGKGKTVRTEKLGMNDSGLSTGEGSSYSVFYNNSGFASSVTNMTIRGGGTTALKNHGTLTLDNVTIRDVYTKYDHGGGIYNSGYLLIKNSFITRNLADAGGGFFTNGSSSMMIIENSTCSENYSIAGGGGAGEISGSSTLYANNTTFSNNQSKEYGGALNLYYSKTVQIQNCTFTGNSTNRSLKYGPAVGVRGDSSTIFKATNSLFAYNYTGNGGKWVIEDVANMLSSSQAVLINCAYTNLNGSFSQTDCKLLDSSDDIFVGGSEMTIIDPQTGDPYSGLTNAVYRPFLVSGSNPLKLSNNSPATSGGCETYWSVALSSGKFTVKTDNTSPKVYIYQNGSARQDGVIGATGPSAKTYYMVRLLRDKENIGRATGATEFGDVYETGTKVTLKSISEFYSDFVCWIDADTKDILSTNPVYEFTLTKNINIYPKFKIKDGLEFQIVSHPEPQNIMGGDKSFFEVETEGQVNYQWYKSSPVSLNNFTTEEKMGMVWEYVSEGSNAGWWKSSNQGISSSRCSLISKDLLVSSESVLKFYWKVSSESGYDKLSYTVSNSSGNIISSNQISGSVASTSVEINLSPDTYSIVFTYSKDGSVDRDEDTGYIKDVKLVNNSDISEDDVQFYTENEVQAKWLSSDKKTNTWKTSIKKGYKGSFALFSEDFSVSSLADFSIKVKANEMNISNDNLSMRIKNTSGSIVNEFYFNRNNFDYQDFTATLGSGKYRLELCYYSYAYSSDQPYAEVEISDIQINSNTKIPGANLSKIEVSPEVNSGFYESGNKFFCEIEYISGFSPIQTDIFRSDMADLIINYNITLPVGNGYDIKILEDDNIVQEKDNYSFAVDILQGYNSKNISVQANGVLIEKINNIYTIENINDHQVVQITGIDRNEYSISVETNGNGKAETSDGSYIVRHGDNKEITFYPDKYYRLDSVYVNGDLVGLNSLKYNNNSELWSYEFRNVISNVSLKAVFVQDVAAFDQTDEKTGIWVTAEAGVVPIGSKLIVEEIDQDHSNYSVVYEDFDDEHIEKIERHKFFDIYILDRNDKKVQPNGTMTIRMTVPDSYDKEDLGIYRILEGDDIKFDSKLVYLRDKYYCEFKTDHFSYYALIDTINDFVDTSDGISMYFVLVLMISSGLVILLKNKKERGIMDPK